MPAEDDMLCVSFVCFMSLSLLPSLTKSVSIDGNGKDDDEDDGEPLAHHDEGIVVLADLLSTPTLAIGAPAPDRWRQCLRIMVGGWNENAPMEGLSSNCGTIAFAIADVSNRIADAREDQGIVVVVGITTINSRASIGTYEYWYELIGWSSVMVLGGTPVGGGHVGIALD